MQVIILPDSRQMCSIIYTLSSYKRSFNKAGFAYIETILVIGRLV